VRRFGGPDVLGRPGRRGSATAQPQVVPAGIFDFAPRKFSSLNFTVFTVFTARAGVRLPKSLRADGEDGESGEI
jgi:hypothetical protein